MVAATDMSDGVRNPLPHGGTTGPGATTAGWMAPGPWLDAFSAARCLGDRHALDLLCLIDPGVGAPEGAGGVEVLFDALRAHHRGGDPGPATPSAPARSSGGAIGATRPAGTGSDPVSTAQAEALLQALTGSRAAFDRALDVALAEHAVRSAEPAAPPTAYLATRLLGAACIARDRGLTIGPDLDCLPRWIIDLDRSDYLAR